MEGAIEEAVDEGIDAHGEDRGVAGEEEGGEGVAEAGHSEEEICPGSLQSGGEEAGEDTASQAPSCLGERRFCSDT